MVVPLTRSDDLNPKRSQLFSQVRSGMEQRETLQYVLTNSPSPPFTIAMFVLADVLHPNRGVVSRRSSDGWHRCQPNGLQVVVC